MKQLLLLLSAFTVMMTARAQQISVIAKDSITDVSPGVPQGGPATVRTYSYNDQCQLDTLKNRSNALIYSYYPNGSLYQLKSAFSNGSSYTDYYKETHVYDASGNTISITYQNREQASNSFKNTSLDSFVYDRNGYKIKWFFQQWDSQDNVWKTFFTTDYYNNQAGIPDSSVTVTYGIYTTRNYYTYYTNSDTASIELAYSYQYDSLTDVKRITRFYDSANYIKRDSTVTEVDSGAGFKLYSRIGLTYRYHVDGILSEYDYTSFFAPTGYLNNITYYTYGTCSYVLPLSFLRFSVQNQNNNAVLQWQTADALNVSSFAIQRSADGRNFITAGHVNASGINSYFFTDKEVASLPAPKFYYRIAETDDDGSVHYSPVAVLDKIAETTGITISPNPVANYVHVYSAVAIGSALITIRDMTGKTVYSSTQNLMAGSMVNINAANLIKGIYIITVQSSSYIDQQKIVKQ